MTQPKNYDWDKLWESTLGPWLSELEGERVAAVTERRYWILAGIALGTVCIVLFLIVWPLPQVAFFGGMGAIFLGAVIGNRRVNKLRKQVKLRLNGAIAQALGLTYAEKPLLPARFETFREYSLLPSYNRRSFEDHFEGEREGCSFELYEAHLEQKRRSKNRTYYVTVFRGALIRITFPRKVEGITVISRDAGWFNGLSALGKGYGGKGLERIGLVDPKFEKIFEVHGNDQVLARYMVTPSFMERLLALEEAMGGSKIRAMFDEASGQGELLIAAETYNRFEAGSMSKPLADKGRVHTLVRELEELLAIIDTLVEPAQFGDHAAPGTE
ncbi:DUF3137 domain-containing protein [Maricaulis parjimensis]|uniref:DUF3137 domain-containing protein n=1 Tax=Maricaulis parjimensis TaxID=144023 RepID=UPI001EEDA052|nr:DUF3137 domain-containing protein [Maricaulis parjimensis]